MMIFLEYLKISLWMTPVILLALWLLPKMSQRYTAKLAYFVWLVIAVRLVVPWNLTLPEERVPIQLDIPQEAMMEWTPVVFDAPVLDETTVVEEYTGFAEQPKTKAEVSAITVSSMQAVFIFWLAGTVVCLLHTAVSTYQLRKMLSRWERTPKAETKGFYEKMTGENRPALMISPVLETPMAVGLFRTKIYLPHEEYTEQEMEMIFQHELIHWRRKDLWYKFLLLLARSIHWYDPFVWLMAKRANRDLEISCDGEAMQEKDMAYRKAYSLMILQEAERGLRKQAALTTCFTDGKGALQERLVEIMNGKKRKKGMALVALTLVLALSCGCLVSYGGADKGGETLVQMAENGILTAEQQEIVRLWAEALISRDGKVRYTYMNEECKAAFIEEQKEALGDDWNYVIGWSSPWVVSYEVEDKENAAIITYTMEDSSPQKYVMKELLKFGEENGKTVVIDHFYSNVYWEDGKVHPIISRTGAEIDEGIWDHMYQSVVGFISQSQWKIYELEGYDFDIKTVTREKLDDTRERVTVDFALRYTYRNPFRDPDDAGYIKRAKEAGHPHYQILYEEYYQQQEVNENMRFTMDIQFGDSSASAETIQLYMQEPDHPLIEDDGKYIAVKAEEEKGQIEDAEGEKSAEQTSIPSGYPTDSMNVTTPFAMGDSFKQHTGLDFSTNNKNIPVYATADGIILEADYDTEKGYYAKINHLNGYTTLYAHLSELDVQVGDKVAKGDILGLTGKTGAAVGIHCHYEIQLNGIYQDPANYL